MQRIKRLWRGTPLFAKIGFLAGLVTLVLHGIGLLSSAFSAFLNRTLSVVFRTLLGYISCIFPFSLAELFLVGLPLWCFLLLFFLIRRAKKRHTAKRMIACALAVLPILYTLFVFTMGFGYLSPRLDEQLSWERDSSPSAEELYETVLWLAEEAQAIRASSSFSVNAEGSTEMPYSLNGMDDILIRAYGRLSETYDFVHNYYVGTKPVVLSHPMAYTGITGVYSFFTGEANLNTAYPDYATVYTAAHEMAHSRGIAREDEANFVAFLACISSEDAYARYCGYANMLQYTINALARADRTLWKKAYASVSDAIRAEMIAYNACVDRYDDTPLREVAESVNNAYLESMGTEGTISYGLVVELAIAYRKSDAFP